MRKRLAFILALSIAPAAAFAQTASRTQAPGSSYDTSTPSTSTTTPSGKDAPYTRSDTGPCGTAGSSEVGGMGASSSDPLQASSRDQRAGVSASRHGPSGSSYDTSTPATSTTTPSGKDAAWTAPGTGPSGAAMASSGTAPERC